MPEHVPTPQPPISDLRSPSLITDAGRDDRGRIGPADGSVALSSLDRETRARRENAAPVDYQVYLLSRRWRATRNRALRLAHFTCQRCGSRRRLEVHHRTYERLGHELDRDLEVVCFSCHNEHHLQESATTSTGVYLTLVSELVKAQPFMQITDLADEAKRLCVSRRIPCDTHRIDRAIALVCGTRLRVARPEPPAPTPAVSEPAPPSHTEALEWLARIRTAVGMEHPAVKSMPTVERRSEHQVAASSALEFVAQEIRASLDRCAALEGEGQTHAH